MSATHARVTNGNDFPIDDRYDGVPYVFRTGEAKIIPIAAAVLFFGMPIDDDGNLVAFTPDWGHTARRWGWNVVRVEGKDDTLSLAMERLVRVSAERCAKIKIEPVTYGLREIVADDSLPEPRESAQGGEEDPGEYDDDPALGNPPRRGRPRKTEVA